MILNKYHQEFGDRMSDSQPRQRKILMVDDDMDDYLITREMLRERWGNTCELFLLSSPENLPSAICGFPEKVDLVLIEYRFDHVGGLEVIKEVMSSCPQLPCIMLTDWEQPDIELIARAYGAYGFLRKKDLTSDQLCTKIDEVLDYRQK
jgi:DNA-binding NtrC family response regulator